MPPVAAAEPGTAVTGPPAIVALAAHPLRWRLLQELTRSDRAVRELTALVGEPQNLVSYHLRKLRDGGVVSARRSSADGRDTYYAIDLAACGDQLRAAGAQLHPGLATVPAPPAATARRRRPPAVLFLCTGNSARSQMAEALATHHGGRAIEAASAGVRPKPLHPGAVRAMRRRGIDIAGHRTKHVDELGARRFDVVVTLCDRVKEVCPELPGHPHPVHWSIPDPSLEEPGSASRAAFERTADELDVRVGFLLRQLSAHPPGRSTHARR